MNNYLSGIAAVNKPLYGGVMACPMCRSNGFKTFINKQNDRAIKNLHIFCTNKDKRCDWQGEINDITGHLRSSNGCSFEEVKCSEGCGLLLQRQHLSDHVDNKCPSRKVHCQYCNMVGKHQFIEGQHVDQCSKLPLPCPNSCGVDTILREDMEAHKATCPLEEIECPNDCGKVLQRQSMSNHIEVECLRRKVDCQYCQLSGEYQFIEGQHKEECPKFPINCPNKCEVGSIPREAIVAHRQECPLEVIECKYYSIGCRNTMARKDWCKHEKEKMEEHLHLTSNGLSECQTKIRELESEVKQNKSLMELFFGKWAMQLNIRALQSSTGNRVLPVTMRVPGYSNKMWPWRSDPFYTEEKGYKLQLKVSSNYDRGIQYVSICLCLMKGPYDDELSWPITERFQVKLLNQTSDESHHSRTAIVCNTNVIVGNDNKQSKATVHDGTKEVWQESQFIKIASAMSSQYLKNDSLIFEVSKEIILWWEKIKLFKV